MYPFSCSGCQNHTGSDPELDDIVGISGAVFGFLVAFVVAFVFLDVDLTFGI
jgi:hypothetical protein